MSLFGAGCSSSNKGVGGFGGFGGGGFGGTGGAGGLGGTGGYAAYGGTGGYAAYGGTGGTGGYAAYGGGDVDGGDDCQPGVVCMNENPDSDDCGTLTLNAEVERITTPGNVLVIFDRSGSMDSEWNGTPKYEVAGNALMNALTPLQDLLTVGGIFFPSIDTSMMGCACNPANPLHWIPGPGACCLMGRQNSCAVNTIDQPDQISFRAGAAFIAEVPNQWRLQGASSTPLQMAVERGAAALANAVYEGPMSVLIVTDGAPNCNSDDQTVINQVTAWAAQGINTHVIGLPGAQNAADLLNNLARAGGGTGYIDPANAADLEMRLRSIVEATVQGGFDSCSITLNPPADVPEELQLVVTENGMELEAPRDLGASGGWSVSSDGVNVELTGAFCDNAQAGTYTSLKFKFGCENLPPLPPPEPPE